MRRRPIIPAPSWSILSVLLGLDAALKSSAADGTVLLQTALCEVMQIGERR